MSTNLNINTNTAQKRRAGFTSEYQDVYDAFTTKPSASIAKQQNIMVRTLVDSGVWAKLDVFYVFAGHTNGAGESLIDWKNPGTYNATAVNAPTFTALEGFAGNGTSSYINLNFIPGTNGVQITRNLASFGCYIRTNIADSRVDMGGFDGTARLILFGRSTTDTAAFSCNDTVSDEATPITDSRGMPVVTRAVSATKLQYRNKALVSTKARASTGLTNATIFVGAFNNNGAPAFFSTKQNSMAFIGNLLDITEIGLFTDTFEIYMDSNGKGVIP